MVVQFLTFGPSGFGSGGRVSESTIDSANSLANLSPQLVLDNALASQAGLSGDEVDRAMQDTNKDQDNSSQPPSPDCHPLNSGTDVDPRKEGHRRAADKGDNIDTMSMRIKMASALPTLHSSPIAPASVLLPMEVEHDDPGSPVSLGSPESEPHFIIADRDVDGEMPSYVSEGSKLPSKYLQIALLAVSEPWSVIQRSLFTLLPQNCVPSITHIVQTVTMAGQTVWLAAASVDAAVMLRGYLVDRLLLPGVRLGCEFVSKVVYRAAASRASNCWMPTCVTEPTSTSGTSNQPLVSGSRSLNDTNRGVRQPHPQYPDMRENGNQYSSRPAAIRDRNHQSSRSAVPELPLLRRDRSQSGQQYRGPRRRFRSPSRRTRRPSVAAPSSPFQSQQPHRAGRSRSSSPRRSRWDQPEGQEPYQAELRNRPRPSSRDDGRPSSSFVSRFRGPRFSYNEQSDYRGRERYHAESHPSDHLESLPAHESGPVHNAWPFPPVPFLNWNPSLLPVGAFPSSSWVYPVSNATELVVHGYQPTYYGSPIMGNAPWGMFPIGHHLTEHSSPSQVQCYGPSPGNHPPTSNVLPIFQPAGVRLHDRIEDRMDNDRNTNFHEQVSDRQPGFPLFKKRGTRGGVKHKKTPVPTGGSLGPT